MTDTYTPALGHAALTPFYDGVLALMTRERRWRAALVAQINPVAGDVIVDVGCGTGSLAILLKHTAPRAEVFGIDPDRAILARASAKAKRAGAEVTLLNGFARDAGHVVARPVTKIVSSLVFHQTPMEEKRAGLAAMHAALASNGEIHIADYGLQRTALMRALFTQVQRVDGFANTTPNARGIMPELMREAGFLDVAERAVIETPTGSISLYFGRKGDVTP